MRATRAPASPIAGVLAGLVAGAAYLGAQMAFAATVQGGAGWEPLQRISAMLLGPDVLPPPADIDLTIAGLALIIHFGLAMAFGRLVDVVVLDRPLAPALALGAAVGLALYGLDYWIVAPEAFPWFEQNRGLTTALDHVIFGGVAAAAYWRMRRLIGHRPAAAAAG